MAATEAPDELTPTAEGLAEEIGGLALEGVGGPDDQEGQPPGTVWFGVSIEGSVHAELQHFRGDPEDVLGQTTLHALQLLLAKAA